MRLTIEVERIEAVNVKPGDVLIVTVPPMTDADECNEVKKIFKRSFPNNNVIVKSRQIGIDVFDGEIVASA